ncbi:MFS transporter, DHA1 family, bicyclomycin/chloramphenicol resistance protein [Zobellia uliginosa]|uniref:MFS transporter, DHA1 family, bicyclomycin/chloramphenicol resistance protein n=1 Tax=Zobellia uliginosa TaxID=143224 RepID=A0ABY1KMK8_9FLAO|nr:multidrug effflux MFS transporter [Zobellia uliginosa]SIS50256.1 MFS transporter, DHA1 family, bicyclomycin/chloramphenicol resistance protein [Zobellia uliginosa]
MQKENVRPNFEFIALMASLMSIVALAIDALLPALSHIGITINSLDPLKNQLLITMIFLGLGVGQLFFGPLSDSYGRKPVVYVGFGLFVIASVICVLAPSLEVMIIGRVLQGIGLSAPRTIAISIIRDTYKGDYMAKIMSFVTAFFILVPVVAPAIGKWIMDAFGWQSIFYVQLFFGLLVCIWFWKRQPETLKLQFKVPFSMGVFASGLKEFLKYRETIAFTFASGFVTGAFLVYLSSSQHVFEDQYGLVENFPYIFAGLAGSVGLSTFLNGTLVVRFGMRKLAFMAMTAFCIIALTYVVLFWGRPNPSVPILVAFLFVQFLCLGFLWGNFRSIAMEPIGHIAGIGAAINGFISTILSVPIANFIGGFVQDTVWPMFVGLAICGLLSLGSMLLVRRPKVVATA